MPDVDEDLLRSRLGCGSNSFQRYSTPHLAATQDTKRYNRVSAATSIKMSGAPSNGVRWNPSPYPETSYESTATLNSNNTDEDKDYLDPYVTHAYTDQDHEFDREDLLPTCKKGGLQRGLTHKSVRLTRGHLVIDCPVSSHLLALVPHHSTEVTRMRYTAVTCDPRHFVEQNYMLRPALMQRPTEVVICLTLYNEDEALFANTLLGVIDNIKHLCSLNDSRTWGPEGWKNIVLVIVADGRASVHPRVLDCLAALGVYQGGIAQGAVDDQPVQAHLFEYSSHLSINPQIQIRGAELGEVPLQILFCLKEQNQSKINSHLWFFEAFCPILNPKVCILVDAGTRPEPRAIYHLWNTFEKNPSVGGACGEICADLKGKWGVGWPLLNPIVAAQNFEYKISNILDKTTESIFGAVSVLPGAFSAYRYEALLNDEYGRGPLGSYFLGENPLSTAPPSVFTSNMYLAEDRILCFELVAKAAPAAWTLQYVKSARAWTDVPSNLIDLTLQRRRWYNGSLFAGIYSLMHAGQMLRQSGHSWTRKFWLLVLDTYHILDLIVAWLSVAIYYLFFRIITCSLEDPELHLPGIEVWNTITKYLYLGTLVLMFVCALGNRPRSAKWKFTTACVILSILTAYMLIAAVFCFVRASLNMTTNNLYGQMLAAVVFTWGLYVVSSIIAVDALHLITSGVQYLVMSSTYFNILQVYALCNLHDLSWGTKGETKQPPGNIGRAKTVRVKDKNDRSARVDLPSTQHDVDLLYDDAIRNLQNNPPILQSPPDLVQMRLDSYKNIRTDILFAWILCNWALVAVVLGDDTGGGRHGGNRPNTYMIVVLCYVGITSTVRFLGSTLYMVLHLLRINQ